jgi:hypothetical protein
MLHYLLLKGITKFLVRDNNWPTWSAWSTIGAFSISKQCQNETKWSTTCCPAWHAWELLAAETKLKNCTPRHACAMAPSILVSWLSKIIGMGERKVTNVSRAMRILAPGLQNSKKKCFAQYNYIHKVQYRHTWHGRMGWGQWEHSQLIRRDQIFGWLQSLP